MEQRAEAEGYVDVEEQGAEADGHVDVEGQRAEVDRHVDVLDGIRAIAIMLIVWFHFWEQTWLTPYVNFNNSLTKYIGITEVPLHALVRFGATFVDALILLSAVCNFYPYARAIVLDEPWPGTKRFYIKRAIRILPSYYLCILVMILFAVWQNKYTDTGYMMKDILTHLTFTSVLHSDIYIGTALNGVLWAVQVEVIYYLLIPWIAKAFRKVPGITCLVLYLCGILSANFILYQRADSIHVWSNYFLNYAGFYASGMLICICYLQIKSCRADNKYMHIFAVLFMAGSYGMLIRLLERFYDQDIAFMSLTTRFELMLVDSIFILSAMLAGEGIRRIFSNRFFKFVSGISYNLYIWHQVIAMKCKEFRIPYWEGDTPPNMTGDKVWQWKYQVIILIITGIVSVALTYGFELPVSKYLKKKLHIQ